MPTPRTIGVDIGGTRLLAGAVDAGLEVHHRTQRAVSGLDRSSLVDAAVDAIEEARSAAGAEIGAVGFGFRGLAGEGSGANEESDKPPADLFAERLGLPAFVDTAANVVALAEHRAGAARGANAAIVVTLERGIGAGLILDRRLSHEAIDPPLTDEQLADVIRDAASARSDSVLAGVLREGREPAAALVTELAHDGDLAAIEALASVGRRVGAFVAEIESAYRPQVAVVGGGVTVVGELLLSAARAELARRSPEPGDAVPIVAARFGVDSVVIGAAALAFDALEHRGRQAA
jgi:glucokinase